jgi:hypothetical protein
VTQNFQPSLPWIIDQDQRHTIIALQISRRDVLLVTAKVCECDRVIIDDFEETFGPAPMLHVRPARCTRRCHVETVSFRQKLPLKVGETIVTCSGILHTLVLAAASVALL